MKCIYIGNLNSRVYNKSFFGMKMKLIRPGGGLAAKSAIHYLGWTIRIKEDSNP